MGLCESQKNSAFWQNHHSLCEISSRLPRDARGRRCHAFLSADGKMNRTKTGKFLDPWNAKTVVNIQAGRWLFHASKTSVQQMIEEIHGICGAPFLLGGCRRSMR